MDHKGGIQSEYHVHRPVAVLHNPAAVLWNVAAPWNVAALQADSNRCTNSLTRASAPNSAEPRLSCWCIKSSTEALRQIQGAW